MARPRLALRCLPRRLQSARLCCALLFLSLLVSLLLSLQLTHHASVLAWPCQDGKAWSCSGVAGGRRGKAAPLITAGTGTGTPYVSSVPVTGKASWLSIAIAKLVDGVAEVFTGPVSHGTMTSRWTYEKDADNLGMTSQQCQSAFPGLYGELARARSQHQRFHIVKKDLDGIPMTEGRVRAGVLGGKLSILKTSLPTQKSRARALAILQSLHDAVSHAGETPLPNIEFVISVNSHVPDLTKPLWVPDRREDDENVWLMPETRFVIEELAGVSKSTSGKRSKDQPRKRWIWGDSGNKGAGTSTEETENHQEISTVTKSQLISEIEDLEGSVPHQKRNRLVGVWRNEDTPENARQKQLVRVADGRAWAEGQTVIVGIESQNSTKPSAGGRKDHRKSISEICRYLFLAHDSSFHISLTDGPLLCSSVIMTTKPKWIQIYHPLMLADPDHYHMGDVEHPVVRNWAGQGPDRQNTVLVADDWGDLDVKMKGLLEHPEVAAAIAENNVETFRKRYLTNAATACYWREMVFAYKDVSFEPDVYVQEGDASNGETRKIRRGISWESFLLLDDDSQMDFDEETFR